MRRRVHAALDYVHEVFPASEATYRRRDRSRGTIYNASCMAAWQVPTWYERRDDVLSCSAPPIPLDGDIHPSSYARSIWACIDSNSGVARLQSNYFACRLNGGTFTAWSDLIGLGRCYVVDSSRVLAVSNHIGLLSFFLDGDLALDELSWRRFAALGWFVGDRTGLDGIRRLPPATRMEIGVDGLVRRSSYAAYDALARRRNQPPDFSAAKVQLEVLARNASSMLVKRPVVQLSGGTDSRLTTAAWLSSGNPGLVRTNGTLAEEAVVGRELMRRLGADRDLDSQRVRHEVIDRPGAARERAIKPLEERLRDAMRIYNGDYVSSCVKANVPATGDSTRITIGGGGGEIAHAQYYPTQEALDDLYARWRGMSNGFFASSGSRVSGTTWMSCAPASQERHRGCDA